MAFAGCRGRQAKIAELKRYPTGLFHIEILEVRTEEGKVYLFVAIDRTSKFAVAQLVDEAEHKTTWEFLELALEAFPYKTHRISDRQQNPSLKAAQKP